MKRYILLLLIIPAFAIAQKKSPVKAEKNIQNGVKKDAFTITGLAAGYADGTIVDLMSGYNGQPEASAVINQGKFTFSGHSDPPALKVIIINKQAPYINFFLGNDDVKIVVNKNDISSSIITGAPVNEDYKELYRATLPYEELFIQNAVKDEIKAGNAAKAIEVFVKKYPSSYVTPLAIIKHYQVVEDDIKMESMYADLTPEIKATPIAKYIEGLIAEANKNPIGKLLPDFTQADTSGQALTLSSLKGKYVLVDFWASWCGPCRQENPNVVSAYHKYKNKNFTVLGVSLDKSRQPWIDAIKKDNLTWPHVSDLKGWQNAVAQQYQIYSIPQNFLLDPNGKVIAKNLRGVDLDQKLESLLK